MMKVNPVRIVFCFLSSLFSFCCCYSQTDTIELPQLIVTSYRDEEATQTSIHVEQITYDEMTRNGSFNLSDAMSKTPGISQLSTGVAISKPVIRGLYGNRVLIMFSGLRFDNQQWQDEHGLGLSDIGISRVEVIKGPYSILYGTEAVAGVVNIIEEEKPELDTRVSDVGFKLNSNTLGGTIQYGYKVNHGNYWYRFRIGAESNADYTDGNGDRILNSRFDGYYAKASLGFLIGKWKSENNYNFSINRFGFIFSDIYQFFDEPDARYARDFPGPHHIVILQIGSSQNTFYLKNSEIKFNAGVQSNQRLEDEGSSISLNMHLTTGEYTIRWIKPISERTELILANISSVVNNTNYGKRKIIPDAWMIESGASAFLEYHFGESVIELGGGGGIRHIQTLLTNGVNDEEKEMDPFTINRPFANALAGVSINPSDKVNIKLNLATGVRSPNLAELSSNGLHEGIYTYEIGDPDMTNETNYNAGADVSYADNGFEFTLSGFYNHFNNYIYLSPTDEEWFGFPIYRFLQQNADLSGGEATIDYQLPFAGNWHLAAAYSTINGTTEDGNYIPFIPADKITPSLNFEIAEIKKLKKVYFFVNTDFVFEQQQTAPEEISTDSYELLNAGFGFTMNTTNFPIELSLTGNNLLNEAYYDHLSRFKPLGLLNIGTNVVLNCRIIFSKQTKTN